MELLQQNVKNDSHFVLRVYGLPYVKTKYLCYYPRRNEGDFINVGRKLLWLFCNPNRCVVLLILDMIIIYDMLYTCGQFCVSDVHQNCRPIFSGVLDKTRTRSICVLYKTTWLNA